MDDHNSRSIVLLRAERYLRTGLRHSHGSPFIAHYDISEPMRQEAVDALITVIAGDLDMFLGHVIPSYPHFALWSIATAVAEEYGTDTDHAVYRLIAERLGLPDIPLSQRKRLNDLFRLRCNMLGLAISHDANRLIDDYLFQAGVPVSQLKHLVDVFQHAEREFGSPSLNDTTSVSLWENRAAITGDTQRTRVHRVLAEDTTGYHAAVYFRLREHSDPETDFELRFLNAIEDSTLRHTPPVQPPYLTFSDGELQIAAASTRGHSLELEIGARTSRLDPGESRILTPPWPRQVRWRTAAQNDSWRIRGFFTDSSTGILVFDGESGRQKDSLNTHDNTQRVPGGSIALVSMQPFEANGEPAYQLAQDAYALFCDVARTLHIEQGDTTFDAEADPRPRLEIDGAKVARRSDGWLLAEPKTVALRGALIGSEDRIEIRVEHPSMRESTRTPVRRAPTGALAASLNLPEHGPFGVARVSVHLRNQDRALHQCRFWYWPSLKGLQGSVFDAGSIPDNLAETDLAHMHKAPDGRLSLHIDPPYLYARLAFTVGSATVSFNFPPPSISMLIRTSTGDESAFAIGARLQIRKEEYASHLVVRCPEADVTLDLRGQIITHPFDQFGLCRIPFAALASGGDHSDVRLMRSNSETPCVLVHIDPTPNIPSPRSPNAHLLERHPLPIQTRPKLVRRRHGRGRRRRQAK